MAKNNVSTELDRAISECTGAAIDLDKVVKKAYERIDEDEWNLQALACEYLKGLGTVHLNSMGYRSVINGKSLYVPVNGCRLEYLVQIYNTQKDRVKSETNHFTKIQKMLRKATDAMEGQLEFNMDGEITQTKTREELLQMLLADSAV